MKNVLLIALLISTLGCSKESAKPSPPAQSIITNPNVTFSDYSYGIVCSGANCYMYVDAVLSNLNDVNKVQLVYQQTVVYEKASPVNGTTRLYHYQRSTIGVTKVPYLLRFTRTDGSTFDSPEFTIPK